MRVEWLTPPMIAKELQIRQSKPIGWIKSGRLPAVNLSEGQRPRYRVRRADLDEFLLGKAVIPQSRPARRQRRELPEGYVEYV
jgi:excisionase family DNA binding protein